MVPLRLLPALPGSTSDADDGPQVHVVVGASSGIGRATALELASGGHHLVLLARREEKTAEVAEECEERGAASATPIVCDVSVEDDGGDAVQATLEQHGRIDAVLHCAGVVTYGRVEDGDADDAEDVVRTNLLGAMTVARHVVPVLREQERGTLVLVGSLLGQIAVPDMTPYVVSKWGVRALARQLRIENLDVPGVRIVHVSPGSVDTDIYGSALDSAGMVNTAPPPTIQPEDAARTIVRSIHGRRFEVQTSLVNYALIAGFTLTPRLWDRLVGPAFRFASRRGAEREDRD